MLVIVQIASSGLELQSELKCDHARRVIASQTHTQQPRGWRRCRDQGAEAGLCAGLSRNSGYRRWQSKVRMVEEIEELTFEAERDPLMK